MDDGSSIDERKVPTIVGWDVTSDDEKEEFNLDTISRKYRDESPDSFNSFDRFDLPDLPDHLAPCPMCHNLGNHLWDHHLWDRALRKSYGIRKFSYHRKHAGQVLFTADQGCSGCKIIAWAMEPYMVKLKSQGGSVRFIFDDKEREDNILSIDEVPKGEGLYYLCYYFTGRERYAGEVEVKLYIKSTPRGPIAGDHPLSKDAPSPWRYIKSAPKITSYTGSRAAIEKVQSWYHDCLSNHKQCIQSTSSQLPTRVICIEEGCDGARLYISSGETAQYACLSHCWGGQAVIQTTAENLEQYTTKLPWDDLPRTFQDAIQFAHALGFCYLWIDSLCIIQDSVDDWRHEGSRMSRIYANASLTLSATWAASPHHGCFVKPDDRYVSRAGTFINRFHETYELHCHEIKPQLEAPLQARGWVLQERMLSKRIVHFMEQELWWECRGSFQCECMEHNSVDAKIGMALDRTDRLGEGSSIRETEELWEEIVQTYTSKSLTYSNDVFPALQGLAKLVPSQMGRYLAGHWESTLVQSLCWYVLQPRVSNLIEWRAPSWSWAAAQSQVSWYRRRDSFDWEIPTYVTILDAVTRPLSDDPMGQISYGSITLRGKCLACQIQTTCFPSGQGIHHIITLEGPRSRLSLEKLLISIHLDNVGSFENEEKAFAMKMFDRRDIGLRQFWLILRATGVRTGEYVRIGIFVVQGQDDTDCPKRELKKLYDQEAVQMDLKII